MKLFYVLFLLPLLAFSDAEWTPLPLQEAINSFSCEGYKKETSFGNVTIQCSSPILDGKSPLIAYVNQQMKTATEDHFNFFTTQANSLDHIEEDGPEFSYALFPVYQTSNLISIYGYAFQVRYSHGSISYEGKTYWQNGNEIIELTLNDLFVKGSGYRQFLLQYCENHFKASGYGYYSSLKEMLPELYSEDLDIFVLTKQGLMIVFRPYRVGGWADGPDTLLIPYIKLKEFIDAFGPLQTIL